MKSQKLLEYLLADASIRCGVSTTRDALRVEKRVKDEGASFLTITLPSFGKDFLQALEVGNASLLFSGFQKKGKLPRFLGGLLDLIFDRCSGDLHLDPSVDAIFCVHCICNLHKKVKSDCTPEREAAAFQKFVDVERELTSFDPINTDVFNHFGIVSDALWGTILQPAEKQVISMELLGRHGPGATAERISGNRKFDFQTWPSRLEPYFPADLMCLVNSKWVHELDKIAFVEPEAELPVRVITVPKTLKAPRIIAVEPVAMQYCQQSLLNAMRPLIERHAYTAGQINFSDQTFNASRALINSRTQNNSTIDLSDASDRVSSVLVYRMLHSVPILRSALMATRSTRANVPGHGVIQLSKFASMGSAQCFDVESMVFFTILVASLLRDRSQRFSRRNIVSAAREVHVYGDDLIVPCAHTPSAIDDLEALGLRVNRAKTFMKGNFRESCGMDAYDGTRITPVYCRTEAPNSRQDVHSLTSWTSLSNQLHAAGFWMAAEFARLTVESCIGQTLPSGLEETGGLVLVGFQKGQTVHHWDRHSHSFRMQAIVLKPILPRSRASGHGSLLKCLSRVGSVPPEDPKHLERAGRPLRLRLSAGRVSLSSGVKGNTWTPNSLMSDRA